MENANEIWKDIKGYPDYQISTFGRVWNKKTNHYVSIWKHSHGYLMVKVKAINGKWKRELVHRLVALTFIPNPNHYPQVDHINRDRTDNNVSNLRWVDNSTNQRNTSRNHPVMIYDLLEDKTYYFNSIVEANEFLGCGPTTLYNKIETQTPYRKRYLIKNTEVLL